MTREEAIEKLKRLCSPEQMTALGVLVPELRESEDERIRKELLDAVDKARVFDIDKDVADRWTAWLEKQKEQKPAEIAPNQFDGITYGMQGYSTEKPAEWNKNDKRILDEAIGMIEARGGWVRSDDAVKQVSDFLKSLPERFNLQPKQKWGEEDEKIMQTMIKEGDLKPSEIEWLKNLKYRLQKEHKQILEVFGFKIGDAVRLKDGDGRKHIIKSFEEVKGIHGPNFYHVEFEDNSAVGGIYPGEKYPNGYYTHMEKFEEEQKPVSGSSEKPNYHAEWSEEDESYLQTVISEMEANKKEAREYEHKTYDAIIFWLKSLRPQSKQDIFPSLSEKEIICLKRTLDYLRKEHNRYGGEDFTNEIAVLEWLITHPILVSEPHWKPSEEQMKHLKGISVGWHPDLKDCQVLSSLYNDLKKL